MYVRAIQKIAYSKTKSDVIARMDGTFTERKKKRTEERELMWLVCGELHYTCALVTPRFQCNVTACILCTYVNTYVHT